MPDFGEDQINAESTGASAATIIYEEEVTDPFEVNAVSAISSAATSAAVAPDVQKNGTSIFTTVVGNVFQGQTAQGAAGGISATATQFDVSPVSKAIEQNSLITIDSEIMLVTGVAGSPTQSPGGTGVQRLTVQRAQQGTTAATHAANAPITGAKPQIPNGGTDTPSNTVNLPVPVPFAVGDVLAIVGAVGATNLNVAVSVVR
jgi:hypothetical protein